ERPEGRPTPAGARWTSGCRDRRRPTPSSRRRRPPRGRPAATGRGFVWSWALGRAERRLRFRASRSPSCLLYPAPGPPDTATMQGLLFVLFVVVAIAVGGASYYLKVRRRDELALFARQHGLEYAAGDPFGMVDMSFAFFSRGDGRGSENVV